MRKLLLSAVALFAFGGAFWAFGSALAGPMTDGSVIKGIFGGVPMRVELALTEPAREKGLGGRTSLPGNYGMLFVFAKDDRYGFWMKDTLVPLDIFWLSDTGQVVYRAENVSTSSYPSAFYPSAPARYVLETAAGFGKAHNIATGTPLVLKKFPSVSK